jgi:hypothetical protein
MNTGTWSLLERTNSWVQTSFVYICWKLPSNLLRYCKFLQNSLFRWKQQFNLYTSWWCGIHHCILLIAQAGGRKPWHSVNFVCAHDGFTLADLVTYNNKYNLSNGEDNRDGENHNLSWNCGEVIWNLMRLSLLWCNLFYYSENGWKMICHDHGFLHDEATDTIMVLLITCRTCRLAIF